MTPHPMVARLRQRRRQLHIRQSVLAERIGYSDHTISNVERGASSPTIDFIEAYATAVGWSLALLAPTEDGPHKSAGEEWQVTFQGEHYSQPQRYATEYTRADAMSAAADAEHEGYKDVRVRMRHHTTWVDIPREVAQ